MPKLLIHMQHDVLAAEVSPTTSYVSGTGHNMLAPSAAQALGAWRRAHEVSADVFEALG